MLRFQGLAGCHLRELPSYLFANTERRPGQSYAAFSSAITWRYSSFAFFFLFFRKYCLFYLCVFLLWTRRRSVKYRQGDAVPVAAYCAVPSCRRPVGTAAEDVRPRGQQVSRTRCSTQRRKARCIRSGGRPEFNAILDSRSMFSPAPCLCLLFSCFSLNRESGTAEISVWVATITRSLGRPARSLARWIPRLAWPPLGRPREMSASLSPIIGCESPFRLRSDSALAR